MSAIPVSAAAPAGEIEFASPTGLIEHLDTRVAQILSEVEASAPWAAVARGKSDERIRRVLRELYLEIFLYQADSIEAAVASIAQMPRTLPVSYFDEMLHHQVEEFDHGEMALRDYIALGGDEAYARNCPQSPGSFAVAAIWRNITHKRDPFAYLGAVYLFDALTPILTAKAKAALARNDGSVAGMEFITHHATADIEHAKLIRNLITDVAAFFPDRMSSIANGFEYFAFVYPLAVWSQVFKRAAIGDTQFCMA
ncbi:MAG: iron-containing redox enzyme family protein [Proteobacteria bacterium]|nr:iron-containing redox enzyme family protein [Pseudomonadota bacterium]